MEEGDRIRSRLGLPSVVNLNTYSAPCLRPLVVAQLAGFVLFGAPCPNLILLSPSTGAQEE